MNLHDLDKYFNKPRVELPDYYNDNINNKILTFSIYLHSLGQKKYSNPNNNNIQRNYQDTQNIQCLA